MKVYDLEQIMFGKFKDHVDALVFENDFVEVNYVLVAQFGT